MGIEEIKRELGALSKNEFRERISPILHSDEGKKIISYGHEANLSAEEKERLAAAIRAAGFTSLADSSEAFVCCAMSQLAANAGL